MRALKEHVGAVLAAIATVGAVEVDALIEPLFHAAADHGAHGLHVFGVVQTHVLDVTAFAQVEVFKLVVLLFKRRNFFRHVHMERVGEVFRAVMRR